MLPHQNDALPPQNEVELPEAYRKVAVTFVKDGAEYYTGHDGTLWYSDGATVEAIVSSCFSVRRLTRWEKVKRTLTIPLRVRLVVKG